MYSANRPGSPAGSSGPPAPGRRARPMHPSSTAQVAALRIAAPSGVLRGRKRLCYNRMSCASFYFPLPASESSPGASMQQRRLRLGDILDDYCPRERRITNHAVVAMIEDEVRQTRCTTCDCEHEFKQAKMPILRKKKESVSTAYKEVLAGVVKDANAVPAPPAAPAHASAPVPPAPPAAASPAAPRPRRRRPCRIRFRACRAGAGTPRCGGAG